MSQDRSGFDISKVTTASRILLSAGVLYFLDLFLQWNRVCVTIPLIGTECAGVSGWHGLGVLNGILVIAIIAMEAVILANVKVDIGTPALRSRTDAGIAWTLLLFTVIKVALVDNEFLSWPAWVGVILAVIMAYGGWMRWQEASMLEQSAGGGMPPPPGP